VGGTNVPLPPDAEPVEDEARWEAERREEDESYRLRAVVDRFIEQHKTDTRLRARYAYWLLGVLIGEVVVAFGLLFLLGFSRMQLSRWVVVALFVGVFGQTAAMVQLVVRGLFQDTLSRFIDLLPKL
jgi:hypothetical protein